MIKRNPLRPLDLVLVAGLLSMPALAIERLDAASFIESCRQLREQAKDDRNSTICEAFLQGYFAGRHDIVFLEDLPSPFVQRAMRTRAPVSTPGIEALKKPRYCLSKTVTFEEIAVKITETDETFEVDVGAEKVIEAILERFYLCER